MIKSTGGQLGQRSLGVALVGLGRYANELRVALRETKYCHIAAIVTGSPAKADDWSLEFKISPSHIYNYATFDRIADDPDVDIVYIVLPNSMHAEYTIRAAKAGKHVICEKPMALSVDECKMMIRACNEANRSLSIGYRLHFEPFNREMKRLGQDQVYGKIKLIEASNGFHLQDINEWRLRKRLAGGGALMDMGIYAIQGARYLTGEEPLTVLAQKFQTDPITFSEVEETICWQMAFPSGAVASSAATYATDIGRLFAATERGWFELKPAFAYSGLSGRTFDGREEKSMELTNINHQAAQLDAIAEAILNNDPSPVPGEEGLKDLKIIEAIYESAETGRKIIID